MAYVPTSEHLGKRVTLRPPELPGGLPPPPPSHPLPCFPAPTWAPRRPLPHNLLLPEPCLTQIRCKRRARLAHDSVCSVCSAGGLASPSQACSCLPW